ncbi:MAG: Riboflavin biosynthesis protein RibF [uncultured bacterium]|nr:MAG: Riboflavin biosynthesis protein RibF [uncultured bacterium]
MRLIRGLYNLNTKFANGCVATIGNYDGVHLGHQQILTHLKEKSEELKVPAVVIIFEPQPEEFFTGDKSLRLTSLREKMQLFFKYGIDAVLVLAFNPHLAGISATNFVEKILVAALHVRYLIIGDDFSFGHKREGDFAFLNRCASSLGLRIERVSSFKIEGMRVSSSFIRIALLQGNLKVATRFLGRPYRVSGRVIHGNSFGRDLGFPTANIHLARRELPLEGVYAVKIYGVEEKYLYGVANIGFCPTVSGKCKSFEVYIFNFNADIYGKRIAIEFCEKIRDEQKFGSIEELTLQIKKDIERTKEVLGAE